MVLIAVNGRDCSEQSLCLAAPTSQLSFVVFAMLCVSFSNFPLVSCRILH